MSQDKWDKDMSQEKWEKIWKGSSQWESITDHEVRLREQIKRQLEQEMMYKISKDGDIYRKRIQELTEFLSFCKKHFPQAYLAYVMQEGKEIL
jgi:hypothetical protein